MPNYVKRDQRINELKKMKGTSFAMEIANEFVVLSKEARAEAVNMLSALSKTIDQLQANA